MPIDIAAPSVKSLYLSIQYSPSAESEDGPVLATGTGFVVEHGARNYLITNRHNVVGRYPDGEFMSRHGVAPDELWVRHNVLHRLGSFMDVREPLFHADGTPRWFEHPVYGPKVDVVALPLTHIQDVAVYPYVAQAPVVPVKTTPSTGLSIVGFPFGRSAAPGMGIWVRGFVA
ncbi:hypothetical protein, partial [Bacillus cereus]|uniref:hypothetical protein n=1 Tax=Bacillus cereus TaxID=1396 RepID=UPI00366984F2